MAPRKGHSIRRGLVGRLAGPVQPSCRKIVAAGIRNPARPCLLNLRKLLGTSPRAFVEIYTLQRFALLAASAGDLFQDVVDGGGFFCSGRASVGRDRRNAPSEGCTFMAETCAGVRVFASRYAGSRSALDTKYPARPATRTAGAAPGRAVALGRNRRMQRVSGQKDRCGQQWRGSRHRACESHRDDCFITHFGLLRERPLYSIDTLE